MSVSNFLSGGAGAIDLSLTEALADLLEIAVGVYPTEQPEQNGSPGEQQEE